MLSKFLKYPEYSMSGFSIKAVKTLTIYGLSTKLPIISPREFPVKVMQKVTKQEMKNCEAVEESPTNQ